MTSLAARVGGGLGRPFWTVLSASALANLADGVFWVALPLLAVGLTDSPALVAGVTVASRLQAVFLAAALLTIILLPARLVVTDARIASAEAAAQAAAEAATAPR